MKKDLSQGELGRLVGVRQNTIAGYESDDRQPDFDTLARIAEVLDVSVDYLLGRGELMMVRESPAPYAIPLRTVPLIRERAPAGTPLYLEGNFVGRIQIPEGVDADFAVQVSGDSMEGAGVRDGDVIYCIGASRRQAQHGNMVVAVLNGGEVTVKWLLQAEDGTWYLRAANPKYRDIPLKNEDDRVQAVVVATLRGEPHYPELAVAKEP